MTETLPHSRTHFLFVISLILKAIFGVIETLGSIAFFLTGTTGSIIVFLTAHELGEDPNDFIANKIVNFLPYFSVHAQFFVAWYLLIHGVVKLGLVGALLKKKLWAYPFSIVVLVIFILYQLYHLIGVWSYLLAALTFFDCIVIYLVYSEYAFLKKIPASILAKEQKDFF